MSPSKSGRRRRPRRREPVTVAGQVAVMAINGLLTKVMFDHNPKKRVLRRGKFPLDWMYPHLTPYGVIMKINRQPLPSLSDDVLQRDHQFWKQFSTRLTGDIIDYNTSIKQICEWIEKTTCGMTSMDSPATASSSTMTMRKRPSPSCAARSVASMRAFEPAITTSVPAKI